MGRPRRPPWRPAPSARSSSPTGPTPSGRAGSRTSRFHRSCWRGGRPRPARSRPSPPPRPKRSVVLMTVSGEEKGLWGSEYFAEHPTVPLSNIVADLNSDMVGRNWKDTIAVIGKEHSDLGRTLNRVAAAHPELRMTPIDDIWPQENFYFRSDHYNLARKVVPILFFFNGTHPDYHQVSDEVAKIDAEKESRIVKLVFYLVRY